MSDQPHFTAGACVNLEMGMQVETQSKRNPEPGSAVS